MKKLLIAITVSLLICLSGIYIKNEFGRKLYKNANYGLERLINQGEVEDLFIGSSMFRQGIDILELENTLSENSFILAYNGNQPVFEYLELKYLIEKGVKIDNLYLDMYAYSAASTPKISDERLLIHTDTKFKFNAWNVLKDCDETSLSVFWEMFVTSNNEAILTYPVSHKLTNKLYRKGGNVQSKNGSTEEKLTQLEVPACNPNMNAVQKDYLCKIIDLCKENNITLFMIETPKWHMVSENSDYQLLMKEYIEVLRDKSINYSLSSRTAECLLENDSKNINFDSNNPSYFLDMVHLSSDGRKEYSSKLNVNN